MDTGTTTLSNSTATADYDRVAQAIRFIQENVREQPTLDAIAAAARLSPHHFHRLFRRWAGITPKRFLQLLTIEEARRRLDESRSVLATAFDVGLSGPGRLHDLFVTLDGVTPGEYRGGGRDVTIRYGVTDSPFGMAVVGRTDRGVCHLSFHDATGPRPGPGLEAAVADEWPGAHLLRHDDTARQIVGAIFAGDRPPLHVPGTNFQARVWEALLRIPEGCVTSYEELATAAGRPGATRAVGTAVGRNRVAWLIPCHRVIRKTGSAGGYRWGRERKQAMLAWEAARAS